ncbi:hypothetical protein PMAYCL1PPCAC_28835, partial [Pristionchus mayeri]
FSSSSSLFLSSSSRFFSSDSSFFLLSSSSFRCSDSNCSCSSSLLMSSFSSSALRFASSPCNSIDFRGEGRRCISAVVSRSMYGFFFFDPFSFDSISSPFPSEVGPVVCL